MYKLLEKFPELRPFEKDIEMRMERYHAKRAQILREKRSIADFANAHHWYGFHRLPDGWVYREWAPAADRVYLTGDFNDWHWTNHPLTRTDGGNWEIFLPGDTLHNGSRVMTIVENAGALTQHIPLYARRVTQDWVTQSWCCEVWDALEEYPWTDTGFESREAPLIYEAHIGMSSEDYRIATYREFADEVLPHVLEGGYNTIQLMAIMEHPYYGSFGYQVSSFYAPSSRFGYPDDLKYLINKAHEMGIRVLLDVVHSHAVANTLEGVNRFDGTDFQFFHEGEAGDHPAWGTKLFNYDKPEVLHFLLSNLKYWIEEFHFDGFRFDGVTSMIYRDHGLGVAFHDLSMYYTMNTDIEALVYLQLANALIKEIKPSSITIAEDMSGMPGMCEPVKNGGIGFDYRLGMGLPDLWIKLIKERRDEDWRMDQIWHELTFRNAPTIAYAESHDQALVGDKTIIFRLADAAMYDQMNADFHSFTIDRAVALHKMIRLLTMSAGGSGYLNFMGNEFGHPEWIDFPREGNGNSFHYCRRQWGLLHNPDLKYRALNEFDRDMIRAAKEHRIFDQEYPILRYIHEDDQVIAFERGDLLFVFCFSPLRDFQNYEIPVKAGDRFKVLFTSDDERYGGFGRIPHAPLRAVSDKDKKSVIRLDLPSRTCVVLSRLKD